MKPILYIVIPCYNEEEVLPITKDLFLNKLKELISKEKISDSSRVMFVNDGSKDSTWEIIKKLALEDEHFIGITQSRNRGHQNAVLAGLMEAKDKCDITISIDCDGQDDINAMNEMVDEYLEGSEIVYGVRSKRDTDTFFKRATAEGFYNFSNFKEVNLFLRGMFPLVGFKSSSVYYERNERIAGESHYPLKKMLALAFDGITSLSIKPIRMITSFGFIVALVSFIFIIVSIIQKFVGTTVTGWTSTIAVICFVSGVQLICMGVLGEYIGKIYMEVKHRPRYIISERTEDLKEKDK